MKFLKKIIKVYQGTKKKGIGLMSAGLTFYSFISIISLTILTIAFLPETQIEVIMKSIDLFAGDAATSALEDIAKSASLSKITLISIFTLIWSATTSIAYTIFAIQTICDQKAQGQIKMRIKAFIILGIALAALFLISYLNSAISIGFFTNLPILTLLLNSPLGIIFTIFVQLGFTYMFFYTTYNNILPALKNSNLRVTTSLIAATITTIISATITNYTSASLLLNNPVIVHLITLLLFLYVLFYTLLIGAITQTTLNIKK